MEFRAFRTRQINDDQKKTSEFTFEIVDENSHGTGRFLTIEGKHLDVIVNPLTEITVCIEDEPV